MFPRAKHGMVDIDRADLSIFAFTVPRTFMGSLTLHKSCNYDSR
jgi:hypothetical protein